MVGISGKELGRRSWREACLLASTVASYHQDGNEGKQAQKSGGHGVVVNVG